MRTTLVVDYDGTLELSLGKPNLKLIEWLRTQAENCRILIWSSRDWIYYDYIEFHLKQWDVPHDVIYCGKPLGDLYIDDRSATWEEAVKRSF